jgi:hypothetical protein
MPKALGSDIYQFYTTGWPKGYFHESLEEEEELEIVDDHEGCLLEPTEKYDLKRFGYLVKEDMDAAEISFASAFAKWKKAQTTTKILVEVPTEKLEEAKESIKALGYKVT